MRKIFHNDTEYFNAIQEISDNLEFDEYGIIKPVHEIICRKIKKSRTLNQNNGYWLWLTHLENRTGQDKEEIHEYFLQKFPTYEIKEILNRQEKVQVRTSGMNVKQMSNYMNKVQTFCHVELGEPLPDLGTEEFERMIEYYKDQELF